MNKYILLCLAWVLALSMAGCGLNGTAIEAFSKQTDISEPISTVEKNDRQSYSVAPAEQTDKPDTVPTVEKNDKDSTSVAEWPQPSDTLYVKSDVQTINDYTKVDDLLNDAALVVKVAVSSSKCANVRAYIYTQYEMEVLDVLYGELDENVITVNMPGGIIEGSDAQAMRNEIFEGKNENDSSNIERFAYDGNTGYLLQDGDEAYLFLIVESESAYAVVGEHGGKMLIVDGEVISDSTISGFKDESAYGNFAEHCLEEDTFVLRLKALIENNKE